MTELKMRLNEGAEIDFTDWNFGDNTDELMPFINKVLSESLSTVFSEDGATAWLNIDVLSSPIADLKVECDIEIDTYGARASAKVSLRELITDAAGRLDGAHERLEMAGALRALADSISPKITFLESEDGAK